MPLDPIRSLRRVVAAFLHWTLIGLGLLGLARPAAGLDEGLSLTFSDDLIVGNDHPDDLYTAELRLESRAGDFVFRLGERMFTRREAGRRFDETFGDLSLGSIELGRWQITPRLGAIRIGKGLLGERAQNEVHDWVGSDRVELDYVEGRRWHATFETTAERRWSAFGGTASVGVEGFAAPDFRQHLRAGLRIERSLGETWRVGVSGGYRVDRAEHELLEGALRGGPTAELGVAWRGLELRWSYNDFGTRAGALSVGVALESLRAAVSRR